MRPDNIAGGVNDCQVYPEGMAPNDVFNRIETLNFPVSGYCRNGVQGPALRIGPALKCKGGEFRLLFH
jgi:hypothetical protein